MFELNFTTVVGWLVNTFLGERLLVAWHGVVCLFDEPFELSICTGTFLGIQFKAYFVHLWETFLMTITRLRTGVKIYV